MYQATSTLGLIAAELAVSAMMLAANAKLPLQVMIVSGLLGFLLFGFLAASDE